VTVSVQTGIPYRALAEEDEETVLTYLQVLDQIAEARHG
jgi:hypothetical protein